MARICWAIGRRERWGDLDAVLFPAAYFLIPGRYERLVLDERLAALSGAEAGSVCRMAARKLRARSPGALVVVGLDTRPRKGWRGDMMVAAFSPVGPVAVTRMIFPVAGDRMAISLEDANTAGRIVRLPSGRAGLLSVCYDAFALGDVATGRLCQRANLRFAVSERGKPVELTAEQSLEVLGAFKTQVQTAEPAVALVAIHRFRRPGADLFWQRHGLATASAALGGGLAIGAAHFLNALPDTPQSASLAAYGVGREHLTLGCRRRAHRFAPLDGFEVALPWAPEHRALARLYHTP